MNIQKDISLIYELVLTEFKLQYQGSILGYVWTLLKPLAIFGILYVIFVAFLRIGSGIPNYAFYLLLGIVLWTFFTDVTTRGMSSVLERGDLIRKINFPKYTIVVAGSALGFINLCFNMIVVFIVALLTGVEFNLTALLVPLLLLELYVFSLSLALLLSAAYIKYRDTAHIWEILILGAFYATPILYPITLVPEQYARLLLFNPVAQIIQDARYAVLGDSTVTIYDYFSSPIKYAPLLVVLIFIVIGIKYFNKHASSFAERV